MKINEVIGEWIIMPQSIKPLGLIRKPGGGFDFKNKGNNRANEKAPPGREKQVKALKGKVDNPYAVAWASYNKSKGKTEDVDQFAPARALGEAQSSLMHGLQMAQNIIKKDYKLAEVQAKVIAENWPPLIDKIQNIYKKEDAAGVGIITKQNTTQDVKPGDEYKNVKKLHLR